MKYAIQKLRTLDQKVISEYMQVSGKLNLYIEWGKLMEVLESQHQVDHSGFYAFVNHHDCNYRAVHVGTNTVISYDSDEYRRLKRNKFPEQQRVKGFQRRRV